MLSENFPETVEENNESPQSAQSVSVADLNSGPSRYKPGVLRTRPRHQLHLLMTVFFMEEIIIFIKCYCTTHTHNFTAYENVPI
jgi:hypothetical protein